MKSARMFFGGLALALLMSVVAGRALADGDAWDGSDSMLYWMIDDTFNQVKFEYAVVYAAPSANLAGKTWTAEEGYGDVGAIALPKDAEGGMGIAYDAKPGSLTGTVEIPTSLGSVDYSGYSFYIELLQWDDVSGSDTRKGVSAVSSYADLVENNHILRQGLSIPSNLAVWAPQTFAAPEPSSGLLLLIGSAILLLRRRTERS